MDDVLRLLHRQHDLPDDRLQRRDGVLVRHVLQVLVEHFGFHVEQLIANTEPSVDRRGTAVHDLRHIDSVIAGNVLVADAAGYREAQSAVALHEIDF